MNMPTELLTAIQAMATLATAAPFVIGGALIFSPSLQYTLAIHLLRRYRLRRATEEYSKAYSRGQLEGDILLIEPERHPLSPQRLEEMISLFSSTEEIAQGVPSGVTLLERTQR